MNNSLKNVFSFIKEALELKNKNIYVVGNYDIHEDLGQFYSKFKEVIDPVDYNSISINTDGVIFKLKYIKEENKKKMPKVPSILEEYIFLKNENDIISKIDNLESELENKGLLDVYKTFDNDIKEINRYNSLIDFYNSKYMQFYNVYKRINDYEEKIEVVFGQKLMVWSDNQNNKIQRYIYEAVLDINVDPVNNIISLSINREKFRGFATDFLNLDAYKVKDLSLFYDYVKEFNDNLVGTEFNINEEAKKYINYVSLENEIVNGELQNNKEIKTLKTYLFDNCGIMVRNKNVKLWIEDLEKIISMCDNTEFISPMLNMFGVDYSDDEQVYDLLNDKTYSDTKEDDVLFPLPSNDEQYKIVDKVKSSNIVLVQGPPGTGKSHTIANLLSHYISEGKKVIVTSEKAKALEVLRDKIPSQIRSLSLALLTPKGIDKDLEFSINTVLKHQKDDNELDKIKNNIDKLSSKLKVNHEAKQNVLRKIIELMSKDTISHKEQLNNIMNFTSDGNLTLMEIAKWLETNRIYAIVPTNDNENYTYTNSSEFFEKLDDICDDIKNNCYAISTPVPEYEGIKTNDIELYIKERLGYKNYQLKNPELVNAIKQAGLNDDVIDKLGVALSKAGKTYTFFEKKYVIENINYEVFINKLKELIKTIIDNKSLFISAEELIYDYSVVFNNENEKVNYLSLIDEMIALFDVNGNISFINKFKLGNIIKKLTGLTVNNSQLQKDKITKQELCSLKSIVNYYILIDKIKIKIQQVLNVDLFEKLNINKNQFGKHQKELVGILDGFINYEKYANEINSYLESIVNKNLFAINYMGNSEDYINSIYSDLKYYATEKSSANKTENVIRKIRDYYKDYNLQSLEKVLVSIEANQLDDYISAKNQLLREISIINKYNDLKKMYPNLVSDKREFIEKYIYKMTFEERSFFKSNIERVFKYHYIEKYYINLESKEIDLPKLYEERNSLINEEKKIIAELVATKGWYYQNKNMNPSISTSLNKWINLKKKLGGGTGKNTNLYLRQMREEMETAKNAIPVWIMPIDKLIEQYPFTNEPPFDVLIMDESSQSSVYSISALSRAKKVIIVGDDKQISPTNAFTSLDGINDIRTKYLRNNSWDLQISRDTSIYDIIQTICGNKKITLTEHFRCLPEIIHYSNKTFYNMEINPLKVRGKENTIVKPIETIFVPNAVCKKSGNQIINDAELSRIITLIADISADKQYENKTIGIITLQNNMTKYIQKMTEAIMQKFGEDFINERKIKIGITYDFQGDERDVIVLSMGVTNIYENGEKYSFRALTTQEFDRSFNVAASRAKEQMILVHSVKLEDLSPSCNRYKLLDYCLNYDNEKEKDNEKLFESNFERDIYYYLTSKGYKLTPQFVVGNYRLDFVLTNDNNQKIAIECDGDIYHGIDELENDLKRQSILERCGWKFARIRASEFYYDRKSSTKKLIDLIEHYLNGNNSISFITYSQIHDDSIVSIDNDKYNEKLNNSVTDNNDNSKSKEGTFIEDKIKDYSENKTDNEIPTSLKEFELIQFKYMTLFSNGVTRREISDYYNVAYDTVEKTLQAICDKYNCGIAEECIDVFKKQWSNHPKYDNIIQHFNKSNNLGIYIGKEVKLEKNGIMDLFNDLMEDSPNCISTDIIIKNVREAITHKRKLKIEYSVNRIEFKLKPINYYKSKGTYYLKAIDLNLDQIKIFKFEKVFDISII